MTPKRITGAIPKRKKGFLKIRYCSFTIKFEEKYSSTVIVHTSPVPLLSRFETLA
jgi:hypothetical protein